MRCVPPRQVFWILTWFLAAPSLTLADNWPQWRGPHGTSVSDETGLPVHWSKDSGIVWRCTLPDQGASTPVIWDDAIFLTAQQDDKLLLLRLNKKTGAIIWTRLVGNGLAHRKKSHRKGQQAFHELHNMASPSPVTDGKRVFVHFGNGDLAAYDFEGKRLWSRNLQKDHGNYTIWWGHANSPVLWKNLVITVCMQDSLADLRMDPSPSYLLAHDQETGELKWKTLRMTKAQAEECDSYTTPLFYHGKDRVEMIIMGGRQIDAYDPTTGKQLWVYKGVGGNRVITGPTLGNGLVYATAGMRGPLYAFRLGGNGQLDDKSIVWQQKQLTPDAPTPVLWKGLLFFITDNGVAQCVDASTGKMKWKERLEGDYRPSLLAADGKIYFLNTRGKCTVVAASPTFEKLAENNIEEETIASLAVSDGKIFLRGKKTLYCIGQPGKTSTKKETGWKSLFDGKSLAGWKATNFGGQGEVSVHDGAIFMEIGNDMTGITYTRGDFPKVNYEVTLEGKKVLGNDFFCTTTFPVGDSFCSLVVGGWGGSVVGLSSINGSDASENETQKFIQFKRDQWYKVRIRVTKDKIEAWIDGKKMVDLAIEDRKISIRPECTLCRPFGIATWRTTGAVRAVQVRALTAPGEKTESIKN